MAVAVDRKLLVREFLSTYGPQLYDSEPKKLDINIEQLDKFYKAGALASDLASLLAHGLQDGSADFHVTVTKNDQQEKGARALDADVRVSRGYDDKPILHLLAKDGTSMKTFEPSEIKIRNGFSYQIERIEAKTKRKVQPAAA